MEQLEFSEEHFLDSKKWLILFEEKPALLIDYIDRNFRESLFDELPVIIEELEEVIGDPNYIYPHLPEVLLHLKLVNESFFQHNLVEEVVLFAFLTQKKRKRRKFALLDKDTLTELIAFLEYEHTIIKEGFNKIRILCKGYRISLSDCVLPDLYLKLERLEKLTFHQIFLESNILFEKIILREIAREI